MLHMWFSGQILTLSYADEISDLDSVMTSFSVKKPRKPPDKENKRSCLTNKDRKINMRIQLQRLGLVSALSVLNDLPCVDSTHDRVFCKHMQRKRCFMGHVVPSLVTDPLVLDSLRDYHSMHNQQTMIDGSFQFIVDTGCSTSASPCKDDFEELIQLPKPVTLHGIAGDSKVTQGGIMRFQCVNTKGEIVTIRVFGYYDTNLHVRLFSPQAFFSHRPKCD